MATAAALVVAALVLAGCAELTRGDGSGPIEPKYPYVELADYQYTLQIHCFCGNSGVPIRITVEDGEAVKGVYLEDGDGGTHAGDVSEDYTWLTLNDVIAAANDTEADFVSVDWPPCQQWPDAVSVDPREKTLDEEYGYTVADVELIRSSTPCGASAQ